MSLDPKFNILYHKIETILKLKKTALDALHRLDIYNYRDLIFYKPHHIIKKKLFVDFDNLIHNDYTVLEVEIKAINFSSHGRQTTKIYCINELGQNITLIYFNKIPPFILNSLKVGTKKIISGRVERYLDNVQMTHPDYLFSKVNISPFEPIYPLTYALNNKMLRSFIIQALKILPEFLEWLPSHIVQQHNLLSFNVAVAQIHNPLSDDMIDCMARQRLAWDELFANQLVLCLTRKLRQSKFGRSFTKATDLQNHVLSSLGFTLTTGQQQVIAEIEQDQNTPIKMMRILQGDVGAGKTLVALLTILNVIASGGQAALMVPTDLVANQHYLFFQKSLQNTSYNVALLTGKTKMKERRTILAGLIDKQINIVIGTHALFQEKVEFGDLAYIVIDEQHKFGVEQRLELMDKGNKADVLVMSATPIPRSLNLTLFGDMDISKLLNKPHGRLPIITSCISQSKITDVMESLQKKILLAQKIYWVCPLIEQKTTEESSEDQTTISTDKKIELTDAVLRANVLGLYYPNKVALIHGRVNKDDKTIIMTEFRDGNKDILVATTVIEVGVDIPNATLIVIENAERFGLAQLHQLRGRVGRSTEQSHCILLYNSKISSTTRARLNIIKDNDDGFIIAEQDLQMRGGGEILGTRQSGEQNFKFANLAVDVTILDEAHIFAQEIINNNMKYSKELLKQMFYVLNYHNYTKFFNLN